MRFPFSSLFTLLLSLFYRTPVAMRFPDQNNLELHFGCHTCQLSYFTLVCLWCGRTVSRAGGRSVDVRSRDYQIFSDGQITSFFYPWCSAGALRAQKLRLNDVKHAAPGSTWVLNNFADVISMVDRSTDHGNCCRFVKYTGKLLIPKGGGFHNY